MITKPSRELIERLEFMRAPRTYRADELVFRQGEQPTAFYYLKSGLIQACTVSPEGQSRTIMTLWPGSFFGASAFFERSLYRSTATAIKDSEVIAVDKASFDACTRLHPEFLYVLLDSLSSDVGVLFDQLADSKLLSSSAKLARFICRRVEYKQYSLIGGMMKINCTQEFMSHTLGLSRWTVNRALMDFKENDWVAITYGGIVIRDYNAIRECGYKTAG